jgi:hypothetical protein
MSRAPFLDPGDLSKDELLAIVEGVREALWPLHDPNAEWSADTAEAVANVLTDYHLRPEDGRVQLPRKPRDPDGYCHACAVPEHDACSLNPNCPCCADTIARMNGREP